MKSIQYIFSFLLIFLWAGNAQAQYQAFSFVTKKDNGRVLTVNGNQLTSLPKRANVGNKGLQQFIMKRLNNGNVLLINVAYPTKCIKRSGTNIVMDSPGSGSTTDYEWRLDFAGQDLYIISHPSNAKQALMMQGNNHIILGTVPAFSSNNANQNDSYRFSMISFGNRF